MGDDLKVCALQYVNQRQCGTGLGWVLEGNQLVGAQLKIMFRRDCWMCPVEGSLWVFLGGAGADNSSSAVNELDSTVGRLCSTIAM